LRLKPDLERDIADPYFSACPLRRGNAFDQKIGAARNPRKFGTKIATSLLPALAKQHGHLSVPLAPASIAFNAGTKAPNANASSTTGAGVSAPSAGAKIDSSTNAEINKNNPQGSRPGENTRKPGDMDKSR